MEIDKLIEIVKEKITIISDELKLKKKIDSSKRIYKVLENELKNYIHSIQLSIN